MSIKKFSISKKGSNKFDETNFINKIDLTIDLFFGKIHFF